MSVNSDNQISLAGRSYNLASLLQEPDVYVRLEAVEQCFALTELVKDTSALVRCAVARKNVGHEHLVFDQDWQVRATVANYCSVSAFLDILAQDSHDFVRFVIAKRGHALNLLQHDQDEEVSAIAKYGLQQQAQLTDFSYD